MILATGILGLLGYGVHGAYDRLLGAFTGTLIRAVEPGAATRLEAVAGEIQVTPSYPDADSFRVRSYEMHLSAPLVLAILSMSGVTGAGWRRGVRRMAVGAVLLFLGHVAALVTQVEFQPLLASDYREPVYYVFRFFWWIVGVWSLWLLPAGAALFVYAADWGLPGARPETRRTAAPVAVASAVALAAVVVLSATLAHLRPPLEAKAPVVEEGAEAEGMEAFRQGRFAQAVVSLRAHLDRRPDDTATRFYLGVSLYRDGRAGESAVELERVRDAQPDLPGLFLALGAAQFDAGRPREAIRSFRHVDLEAIEDPALLVNIGGAFHGEGERAGAERAYQRALVLDAEHPPALLGLGRMLLEGVDPCGAEPFLARCAERGAAAPAGAECAKLLEDLLATCRGPS